jgi:RNA polymerase sigma-70 factor (ECF subfamily)
VRGALADDLAQETFMLAFRNLGSFRQEAKFSTWLYRIATNAFLAAARKRKEEPLGDRAAYLDDAEFTARVMTGK